MIRHLFSESRNCLKPCAMCWNNVIWTESLDIRNRTLNKLRFSAGQMESTYYSMNFLDTSHLLSMFNSMGQVPIEWVDFGT